MELKEQIDACNDPEQLLDLWNSFDKKEYNIVDSFMKDGLMHNDAENQWWDNPKFKVMFLLKEGNGNGGDTRDWLRNVPSNKYYKQNYNLEPIPNQTQGCTTNILLPLARILYGINELYQNSRYCKFEDIPYKAELVHTKLPFAYIEAKKIPGSAISHNPSIKEYVKKHKEFLSKEIQLYRPTIIICCDNHKCGLEDTICDLLSEEDKKNIKVITTYHPSARGRKKKEMYDCVMNSLNPFNKYDVEKNLLNTSFRTSIEMLASKHGLNCKYTPGNWCKQYEGQFSFYKPEWKHFCICFEFMGDNLTNFNYGVRYKDDSALDQDKKTKEDIAKKLGGTTSQWYASYKPFDPKDWNNNDVLDRLRNDAMTPLIGDKIDSLLKQLEGICL